MVGGNDGWAGMADAVALRELAFPRDDSQNPSFPREASFPLNPSFPRKRESRDLCDRKAGLGRMALDSWSPIGVGDELRGMMEAQWIPAFAGMTGGWE